MGDEWERGIIKERGGMERMEKSGWREMWGEGVWLEEAVAEERGRQRSLRLILLRIWGKKQCDAVWKMCLE